MRSGSKILLCIWLLLCSSGCGFKDIDQRFFVVAIGVDQGKEMRYEITLKLAIPTPAVEPGKAEFQLISREADHISEAFKLLSSDVDKQLDMGHAKIIIFSRAIGQEQITEALQGFIRRRDIQRIEYLALGEPTAKSLLAVSPKSERLAANSIVLMFEQDETLSPYIMTEYMYEFYRRLLERGKDPFLPVITVRDETLEINRVALYNKSSLVMTLSKEQTAILNQLIRGRSNLVIVATERGMNFALTIEHFHYKYEIDDHAQPTQINIQITMKAIAEEASQSLFNQDWSRIELLAEKQMKQQYIALLEEMRDHDVDPIGFGLRYIATHHHKDMDWVTWNQLYPKVKFNVNVDVILIGTGVIK